MFARLLPKSAPFFALLLQQSELLLKAARCLEELFADPSKMDENHKIVALLEEEADNIYARVTRELSRTFITPIDREDILHINQAQENCIDFIQTLTTRMHIFNFPHVRFPSSKLAETMRRMLELTQNMLQGLSRKQDAHKTRAFRALRGDCEMLLSVGLVELYENAEFREESVPEMMKWAQTYDRLDSAVGEIVKLAETIEEAVLKNV
jgi:uncharacterized protein Yka (UPF0111/DUF47 family)